MCFTSNASLLSIAALLSVAAIPAQAESGFSEFSEVRGSCGLVVDSGLGTPHTTSIKEQTQWVYRISPCAPYKADKKPLDSLPADGIQRTKPMVKERRAYGGATQIMKPLTEGLNSRGESQPIRSQQPITPLCKSHCINSKLLFYKSLSQSLSQSLSVNSLGLD